MKKNEIFTFTAPNGVEVIAIVVAELDSSYNEMDDSIYKEFLCYAQNRLFTYAETYRRENAFTEEEAIFTTDKDYGKVLVDYIILPNYDIMLESYLSKKSCEEEVDTLTEKELYL